MLESDQKVGEFKNEREDPVFSMNNLKDVPFGDFLILHKIFPKIFMLELDTKPNKCPSRLILCIEITSTRRSATQFSAS